MMSKVVKNNKKLSCLTIFREKKNWVEMTEGRAASLSYQTHSPVLYADSAATPHFYLTNLILLGE